MLARGGGQVNLTAPLFPPVSHGHSPRALFTGALEHLALPPGSLGPQLAPRPLLDVDVGVCGGDPRAGSRRGVGGLGGHARARGLVRSQRGAPRSAEDARGRGRARGLAEAASRGVHVDGGRVSRETRRSGLPALRGASLCGRRSGRTGSGGCELSEPWCGPAAGVRSESRRESGQLGRGVSGSSAGRRGRPVRGDPTPPGPGPSVLPGPGRAGNLGPGGFERL